VPPRWRALWTSYEIRRERESGSDPHPAGAPDPTPVSAEDLAILVDPRRPDVVGLVGIIGLLILLWLMMFKPF
jgi:hypothetical protein